MKTEFRYHGDAISGYFVSIGGTNVGRVERTDPSGRPDTRKSGWIAIPPQRQREEFVHSSRDSASYALLNIHRLRMQRALRREH